MGVRAPTPDTNMKVDDKEQVTARSSEGLVLTRGTSTWPNKLRQRCLVHIQGRYSPGSRPTEVGERYRRVVSTETLVTAAH